MPYSDRCMKVLTDLNVRQVPVGVVVRAKTAAATLRITLKDYVVLAIMDRVKADEARELGAGRER